MKVQAIALNTFREAVRNKILYSVVLFAAIVVAAAALFGKVTMGDPVKVIKDFGLFSLSFFGAVITIITGVSLLGKEIKQKTVYNIISKPVDRWQFIVGKYFGLFFTVASLVTLMGLGLLGFVAIYEGEFNPLMFQGIFYVILEVAILAAVAIFFSTVVVTVTLTGLFTLGTWITGRSISYMNYFIQGGPDSPPPSPVLKGTVKVMDLIVPDLSLLNVANEIVHDINPGFNHAANATIYTICFATATLIVASFIFSKRELV